MKRTMTVFASLCVLGGCVLAGAGAGPGGAARPKAPAAKGIVKLPHLRVDLARRQVAIDANVCLRIGFLEVLLCRRATKDCASKEHESILRTDARAADIHAGLMLLGLRRGKPAELMPAREGQPAVWLPPRGPEVKLLLRWKDKAGKQHEADPVKWLAGPKGGKPIAPKKWVFVGSDILPDGGYWADTSGDIISVSNFASAVIDVPFKSTSVNDFLEFTANTAAIPPKGTPVEVIIIPLPGARNAPHARAMLEIGRFGRMRIEGRPITFDQLTKWGQAYIKRHPDGRVVIRTAVKALATDLERAKSELHFGGVADFQEQRLLPLARLLPRTGAQADRALQKYREDFANRDWAIPDPVEAAEEELKRIAREIAQLKRLESLWREYRVHLKQQLDKHRATTQPAATRPGKPAAEQRK